MEFERGHGLPASPTSGLTTMLQDLAEESSKCADTCTSGSSAMQCGETSSAGTAATLATVPSGTDPLAGPSQLGARGAASQLQPALGPGGAPMPFTSAVMSSGIGFPHLPHGPLGAGGVPHMASAATPTHLQDGAPTHNGGNCAVSNPLHLHRVSSGVTACAHAQASSNGYGFGDAGAAFPRGSDATAAAGAVPGAFAGAGHGWTMGAVPQPQAPTGGAGGGSRRGRKPKPRLPDLQLQLEALSQQFERLSSENVFLKSKLKALEKVVPNRQVNLDFLASVQSNSRRQQSQQHIERSACTAAADQAEAQQATSSSGGAGPAAVADAAPLGVSRQSSGGPAAGGGSASGSATGLGSALLPGGAIGGGSGGGLPSAASASALAEAVPPGPSGRGGGAPQAPQRLLILELCPGPDGEVPDMTPAAIEELKRTGVKEFLALWKHVTLKMSVLVAAAEALGPGSAHAARLERYVGRMMDYLDRVILLSPDVWFLCQYINAETMEEERPGGDGFWMAIGKYANFSREQLEEIESLAKAHEETVAPVVQERARLASELSNHISATTSGAAVVESAHGISALNAVDALTEQLQRNVLKEQQTHIDATDFLCWSVVTPVQVARIMAASYPYVPDGVALMHACRQLYRQAQEQHQQQKAAALQSQQQHSQ